MSAGRPNSVLSLLPPVGPSLPTVSTGLPSLVYLKTALSVSALPVIQTKPLRSTWMPCSLATHGLVSGPPQPWMKLPSASNSMTDGAGAQHLLRGGLSVAPFSSSVSERLQHPDMVVRIDGDARHLTEDPVVGQRLGPEGIDLELRRVGCDGGRRKRDNAQQGCK